MHKKVVVENTLPSYIEYFQKSGYDVHRLYLNKNVDNISSKDYDGIIVTDLNSHNLASQGNRGFDIPIIEAKGKSPEEVYNMVKSNN